MLLTKLSGRDVVAQEIKYHPTCLAELYNREKAVTTMNEKSHDNDVYPLTFSELISYIMETEVSSDGPTILRLKYVSDMYEQRLQQLGIDMPNVNATRLKDMLLK
jgi:hypothetical protein